MMSHTSPQPTTVKQNCAPFSSFIILFAGVTYDRKHYKYQLTNNDFQVAHRRHSRGSGTTKPKYVLQHPHAEQLPTLETLDMLKPLKT